jgi:MFS family permease
VLFGPFAGPLADSHSRHRLMLIADTGRAVLLATIPVAVAFGGLRFWVLVVVAFLTGSLTLVFNIALQAYLPSLVPAGQIGVANARLSASQSAAEVTGPGFAAGLIALGGASVAVAADAVSYVLSALFLCRLPVRDAGRRVRASGPGTMAGFWRDTKVGFTLLKRDPVLRAVTRSYAILTFFSQMQAAVYFLFLTRDLRFGAGMISIVFTAAGVIGLFSAIGCNRVAARADSGRLIVLGQVVIALGGVLLAAATGPIVMASALITLGEACFGTGLTLFAVGYQTLFQLRTEDQVRGRVIGAARFLTAAPVPLAAVIAGVLGTAGGPRVALIAGAAGMAIGLAEVRPLLRFPAGHAG